MPPRRRPLIWLPRPPDADCAYHPWLVDRGSLTRRLQDRCERFEVRHVVHRYGKACRDEARLMGLRSHEFALLREVYLYCDGRPVVFAHTVIPRSGLRGPWHDLGKLGNRPLGAALFANPAVRRTPLRFRKLTPNHELFRRACQVANGTPSFLWARRSIFRLGHHPILVTEVFLPTILDIKS